MPQVPPPTSSVSNVPAIVLRVFAALLLLGSAILGADLLLRTGDAPLSRCQAAAAGLLTSAAVLAGLWILVRRIERRTFLDTLGLGAPGPAWRPFLVGVLAWLLPAALALAVALGMGWASLAVNGSWPDVLGLVLVQFVVVFLVEAFPEETALRGYVGAVLGERLSRWPAILLQALLFTGLGAVLTGRAGATDLSLFLAMGIVFGYLREITGTVWTSIGFHAAFQTGAQLLIGGQRGVLSLEAGGGMGLVLLGIVPFSVCLALVELAIARGWLRDARVTNG